MCAGWPHQGLRTRKIEEEGDGPFLKIQQSANVSCGESLTVKSRTQLAFGATPSQC